MLSPHRGITGAIALTLLLTTGALAQQAPHPSAGAEHTPGVGDKATDPSHVDKGQNTILPSAGNAGPSAAPTMVYDCQKNPSSCSTPATPADKAGASETNPIKP